MLPGDCSQNQCPGTQVFQLPRCSPASLFPSPPPPGPVCPWLHQMSVSSVGVFNSTPSQPLLTHWLVLPFLKAPIFPEPCLPPKDSKSRFAV